MLWVILTPPPQGAVGLIHILKETSKLHEQCNYANCQSLATNKAENSLQAYTQ